MKLAPQDLLCVLDCEYLHAAARHNYGGAYRVAYARLMHAIKETHPGKTCWHFEAFIPVKNKPSNMGQLQLVSLLQQWGFGVHAGTLKYDMDTGVRDRQNITAMMVEYVTQFQCHSQNAFPSTLVVASRSVAFADVYGVLMSKGITVEVVSFGVLSPQLSHVSAHIPLDESLLYLAVPHS